MPILDICDEAGLLHPWASARLYATMLFPGSSQSGEREQVFEQMLVRGFDKVDPDIERLPERSLKEFREIKSIAYRNLDDAGIGSNALITQAARAGAEGWLAGMMLRYLLRCLRHGDLKSATMNKAYYVVNCLRDAGYSDSADEAVGIAVSLLKEYWKRHASDRHLHAAALAFEMAGPEDDWLAIENIPAFVAISEVYAATAPAKFLDSAAIWRPPPSLKLPEMNLCAAMEVLFPPLGSEELAILETYRA